MSLVGVTLPPARRPRPALPPKRRPRKGESAQAIRRATLAVQVVGGERPIIPAGLPLVWTPRLVVARLGELGRLVHANPGPGKIAHIATHDAIRPEVRAWAAEAGVVFRPGRTAFGGYEGWARCPFCERLGARLIAVGGFWRCSQCTPEGTALGVSRAADYAFGLRIGCRGRRMTLRRRSLVRHAARLAANARRPRDLLQVAQLAALVRGSAKARGPLWQRLTRRLCRSTLEPGPFRRWAAPYVIPALIDNLLHPAAFLERFGGET